MTRDGGRLTLGGRTFWLLGYNVYYMACDPKAPYETLDYRVAEEVASAHANTIRLWYSQSCDTSTTPWSLLDRAVAIARQHRVHLVVTFANQWGGDCGVKLALEWYASGYTQANGICRRSFREFVREAAQRYAGEPAIAVWQLVNEAQADYAAGDCDQVAAALVLRSFADDMTATIRSVDPNHLVSLGTIGNDGCGLGDVQPGRPYSALYEYVHAGLVDLCEVHDYAGPDEPLPASLAYRAEQCHILGKPLIAGEVGISRRSVSTLSSRALALDAKMVKQLPLEAGFLVWHGCSDPRLVPVPEWEICPGDPASAVMALYADELTDGTAAWLIDARPGGRR